MQKFKWVSVGYASLMLVWFSLWLTVKDAWWGLALLNRAMPGLFLPAPFLLAIALVNRQRWPILVSLIPLGLFVGLYWPYLVPHPEQNPAGQVLRVMTFNVLYSNMNYEAVANVVLTYQPDLVALQEVQPEMMAALTQRLKATYPYSFMNARHPFGTTAAFSRYPIVKAYPVDLDEYRSPRTNARPAAVLKVMVAGQSLTFIAAHLLPYNLGSVIREDITQVPLAVDQTVADEEGQAALLISESKNEPTIVACDCNSQETSIVSRLLAGALTSSARKTGWLIGSSAPAGSHPDTALDHIDYVFYRGPWEAVGTYAIQDAAGSDHLPILSLLQWHKP